jgi:hypothetical protein
MASGTVWTYARSFARDRGRDTGAECSSAHAPTAADRRNSSSADEKGSGIAVPGAREPRPIPYLLARIAAAPGWLTKSRTCA